MWDNSVWFSSVGNTNCMVLKCNSVDKQKFPALGNRLICRTPLPDECGRKKSYWWWHWTSFSYCYLMKNLSKRLGIFWGFSCEIRCYKDCCFVLYNLFTDLIFPSVFLVRVTVAACPAGQTTFHFPWPKILAHSGGSLDVPKPAGKYNPCPAGRAQNSSLGAIQVASL